MCTCLTVTLFLTFSTGLTNAEQFPASPVSNKLAEQHHKHNENETPPHPFRVHDAVAGAGALQMQRADFASAVAERLRSSVIGDVCITHARMVHTARHVAAAVRHLVCLVLVCDLRQSIEAAVVPHRFVDKPWQRLLWSLNPTRAKGSIFLVQDLHRLAYVLEVGLQSLPGLPGRRSRARQSPHLWPIGP